MSIELNSEEQLKQRQLKDDKYNKYHREYARNQKQVYLSKSETDEIKANMYEYNTHMQQNLEHTIEFHEFVIHFARIGFNEWKTRTKGK